MTLITPETREYLDNLVTIQAQTGEISAADLAWLITSIEKADDLAVAARTFVDIAKATVEELEAEIADRDATIEGISTELDEVLRLQNEEKEPAVS
jgi:hypothetical protein